MQSSTDNPEADFRNLHQRLRNGRISIDGFLEAIGFEKWLGVYVYSYDFLIFEGLYGREDLIAESSLKVIRAAPELDPQNIPDERAFFGWLKTLVFHTYLDALRKQGKALRHMWVRSDEPIEDIPAPDEDFDGRYFLDRFLDFIKVYRPERRLAIMLWLLNDYSYREVEEALLEEGVKVSRVTVGKWVTKSLESFAASLKRPLPERLPRLTGGARPPTVNVTRDESYARKTPAEALAEIAALPLEGASDLFSGREHDSILYPRK